MPGSTYRVKFIAGEADFVTTELDQTALCDDIIRQVRVHKRLPPHTVVRLICSGREIYPEDSVERAVTNVVHCIISEGAPPERMDSPRRTVDPPPPPMEPPPPDWLDMIDPGAVLMWIFCSFLVILWFAFLIYPSLFDRTSFLILCMMAIAYFIPYLLSFISVPAFLQPPPMPPMPGMMYDPNMGRSNSLPTGGTHFSGPIPPRPKARIPPGGSM